MKLPIPFLKSKKDDSNYFLALILSDEKVEAIILRAEGTSLKTIGRHEEPLSRLLEELSQKELINSVDKAISRAEEVLPPQIETHKTVFGVKENWVEKESKKIKKEYLDKLKKVCDALDLSPIGFMVTTEAVTHLIQDEEGAPLSAIFAEIGKNYVTLKLLRGGKTVESVQAPFHESAPATVDKLLSHFTVPVLPARIVLFIHQPEANTAQVFTKYHWSKSLPFLHVPHVTVLPKGFDSRSVMYGAASQMGFTVSGTSTHALSKAPMEDKTVDAEIDAEPKTDMLLAKQEEVEYFPEDTEHELKEAVPDRAGDFGFVVDEELPHEPLTGDNFDTPVLSEHSVHRDDEVHHNQVTQDQEMHHQSKKQASFADKLSSLAALKMMKMPKTGKLLGGFKGNKTVLKIGLPIAALVILGIITTIVYIYHTTATVQLTVSPKTVQEEQKIVFSLSNPNNFDDNVIAAKTISVSLPANASIPATGKKDVGEKAKGTLTIYNNSANTLTLDANTEFKANNGEIFVLDKDTKLASASGDIFTGTKPGTTQASVTAKDLGTEGNLPSGTRFAVGSTSTIAARNDSAFSGGTKKNVTIVSKADLEKLKAELPKSIQSDAKNKLAEKASSAEKILPLVSNPTIQNPKYDKKEGDEAKQVTLKADVVFSGMAYQDEDMQAYAKQILTDKYKDDVTLAEESIKESVADAQAAKDNKSAKATVMLEAELLPKIEDQDVIENIKDKSISEANKVLSNLPQVTKTNIALSPPLPIISGLFTRLPNQIVIEIKTE